MNRRPCHTSPHIKTRDGPSSQNVCQDEIELTVWDIFRIMNHEVLSRPLSSRSATQIKHKELFNASNARKSSPVLLPSERTALGEPGFAACGLAEDGRATLADDHGLGVREDGGDGEAAGALHIHEEGPRRGHEGLELVLADLGDRRRIEEIDGENHFASIFAFESSLKETRSIAEKIDRTSKICSFDVEFWLMLESDWFLLESWVGKK